MDNVFQFRDQLIERYGETFRELNRVTRSDVMTFHHAVFEKGYATEWSPLRTTARASAICRRRKWAEFLMSSMPTAMCRWVR